MCHLQGLALPCHLQRLCRGLWQACGSLCAMRHSPSHVIHVSLASLATHLFNFKRPALQQLPEAPASLGCMLGRPALCVALGPLNHPVQISKTSSVGSTFRATHAKHPLGGRRFKPGQWLGAYSLVATTPGRKGFQPIADAGPAFECIQNSGPSAASHASHGRAKRPSPNGASAQFNGGLCRGSAFGAHRPGSTPPADRRRHDQWRDPQFGRAGFEASRGSPRQRTGLGQNAVLKQGQYRHVSNCFG